MHITELLNTGTTGVVLCQYSTVSSGFRSRPNHISACIFDFITHFGTFAAPDLNDDIKHMSATKRTLGSDNALSSKRTRQPAAPPRLCDLGNGSALFADKRNSSRAKERGYLRNRDASDKYEEVCGR